MLAEPQQCAAAHGEQHRARLGNVSNIPIRLCGEQEVSRTADAVLVPVGAVVL